MSDNDKPAAPTPATARPLRECRSLGEAFQTEELKRRISQALPSHMKMDAMLNSFMQATSRTPDLLKCDLRQAIGGFLTLAELGLPLTPTLGMAHMIPFRGRVQNPKTRKWEDGYNLTIIIGYQGYIELAMRTGRIGGIHADIVYPEDSQTGIWEYEFGTRQDLRHRPSRQRHPGSKPTEAYCIAHLVGDVKPPFEVYPWSKIMGIRDRSQGYLKALTAKQAALAEGKAIPRTWTDAPWVRDEEAMAKKTMIRAAQKMWPKSPELQGAAAIDDPERGYVDFGPIVDAQPGDVHAVDLPVEEEPGDPGAAFSVRTQPPEPSEPAQPQQGRTQAPSRSAAPVSTKKAQETAPAKTDPPKTRAPDVHQEEEPPPADPSDFGLGSIPQSHVGDAPQQTLPQQESNDFEAYVFDEVGEAVSDLYTDPTKWAGHLRAIYDPADLAARNVIVENNMDALAAARPLAADLLRDVMIRQPAAAPAPKAAVIEAVAVPQTRGGKPDWVGYMKAVRDVLPHLGVTISAEPWVLAQLPALAECPTTQRINLIGDIAKRMSEFGQKPPPALAALVQAKPAAPAAPGGLFAGDSDRAWVDARKAEIDKCATRDEIAAITLAEANKLFLRGLRERNPLLMQELVNHATTLANTLEQPG